MVNGTVVTVGNRGKKYQIRHQRTERYTAREKIATRAAALLRPLLAMVVFVFIFGRIAKLPAEGLPYTLMFFAAMLPAGFLRRLALARPNSLIINSTLMSKSVFRASVYP